MTGPAAAVLLGILLAGCTVRPVYMQTAPGLAPVTDLSAIAVGDAGDRVGQEVRNNLIFLFTGGRPPPPTRYTLSISVSSEEERLGFQKDETAPAYQVTVRVKFELKEIAGDRVILRSSSAGVATYNRSNQNFANVRAKIDAENRAAQAVAEQVQLRLAIAVAKEAKVVVAPVSAPPKVDAPAILGGSQ